MSTEVSFNLMVITDLEENFPETLARSEAEGGQKDMKDCAQEKAGKCFEHYSLPICIAWLNFMHENMCGS